MAIIISKDGKDAERVESSNFVAENNLQEYIYKNPNVIPLYDIDSDIRLFIVAREFQTKSGPIDALGFDQNGNIYVIETKLYSNQDKRKVVAQLLDYGASLWRNTTDFDQFIEGLSTHTRKQFGESFEVSLSEFFALEDVSDIILAIKNNLNAGNIKFVVLMDKLHNQLKDLIVFINQNSQFDIYAVEVEYYKHDEFEIMIPKLFGDEVKKEVVSTKSKVDNDPWQESTEEAFLADIRKRFENNQMSKTVYRSFIELHGIYSGLVGDLGGRVEYFYRPKTDDVRCFFFYTHKNSKYLFIILDSMGRIEFWKHAKVDTVQEKYISLIEEEVVRLRLFGKDKITRWWGITFSQYSDQEAIGLVEMSKKVLKAISL